MFGTYHNRTAEILMKKVICDEIRRFVLESPENRFPESDNPYFEEPLIGFAAGDDPLFERYLEIIGPFHMTPEQIMKDSYGETVGKAGTVICWILPISPAARESNRLEQSLPSLKWAQARDHGEKFNNLLRMHVVEMLRFLGAQAVAPLLSGMWRPVKDERAGLASTWSERHAAYAAGLGTFSLSDGFITEKGIAHRCGSVITDEIIAPDEKKYADPWSNCLFYRDGSCGACIGRCPVGAISAEGHDKEKCYDYVYIEARRKTIEMYGLTEGGCGLCQTKVPCEARIP
jgi:epoxyqueuosine reductase QueG